MKLRTGIDDADYAIALVQAIDDVRNDYKGRHEIVEACDLVWIRARSLLNQRAFDSGEVE